MQPDYSLMEEANEKAADENSANPLSSITFSWMWRLLLTGKERQLEFEDLRRLAIY